MIKIGNIDFTDEKYIIDIRDKSQVIKARVVMPDDAVYGKYLMKKDDIQFSFEYDSLVSFVRGDYIEYDGARFVLDDENSSVQENSQRFVYSLVFQADYMLLKNTQMYYVRQNLKEVSWSLTSDAASFIKTAVDNANRYFNTTHWQVGTVEPTGMKYINFDSTSVLDALTQIAEQFDAEWYITGKTINLVNKLSYGSEIDFESEVSVVSMTRSEGENSTQFNRIVALGSTRNIPANYRQTTPAEAVDAIYQKRLRIPASKGDVIDAYPNMSPEEVVEGSVIFDDVYPQRTGTMSDITTKEYTVTDEDTGVVTKWNAYRYKDTALSFKELYILPGQELRIVIQSGKLNGMDFAVKFNPDGYPETDARSQIFEIVRSEDYGAKLPNDVIKPENGDKYILYGFDIQLVSDQYVPAAEQELYDKALEWLKNNLKDKSVYTCPSIINYFAENSMDLDIGQKVRLINGRFEKGYRSSRIMGFEKKLYNIYDATYTVGDNAVYSRLANIEKEIEELKYAGQVYQNTGGGSLYLIKQFDTTSPTDFNTYSAKAQNARFLKRDQEDSALRKITFADGIDIKKGAVSNMFGNDTFTSGQFGSGFRMWQADNGQSYAEFDNLMIRREMIINTLTIAEIKSVGGQILVSLANMNVIKVEERSDSYRCFFETDNGTIPNQFAVDDQAICRKFNGQGLKYYWRRVTSIGSDYIDLSKVDSDGAGIPAERDEIIQFGNRTNTARQTAIIISAYGSDSPSIKQYVGINTYNMTGKEVTVISPSGNKFTGEFKISTNGTTSTVYKDRGTFSKVTTYYLNDRISYNGAYWVCIAPEEQSTSETPSETALYWRQDTTSKGDITNAVDNIQVGGRNLMLNSASIPLRSIISTTPLMIVSNGNYFDNLVAGETYQVSFDAKKISGNGILHFEFWGGNGGDVTIDSADTFTRYGVVAKYNGTKLMYLWLKSAPGEIEVKNFKFETGNKATDWTEAPEDIQARINVVQTAAANAKTDANTAQSSANTANSLLADIANDNKFVPSEKQEVKREWDSIVSEYTKNVSQASIFSISSTIYTNAYNSLNVYITPLLSNLNATSDIIGTTFRNTFKTYYDARLDLLNAIAKKAKDLADAAQNTANQAQSGVTQVKASLIVLNDKIESKVLQSDFNSLQGRVSTAESTITQQAGQIQSTVDKVDKKSSAYKSYTTASTDRPTVPYSKGDIWITYDGRILQAANTRLSGSLIESDWKETVPSVNDIQIGGINLVRNSAFQSTQFWGKGGNHSFAISDDKPTNSQNKSMQITATGAGTSGNLIQHTLQTTFVVGAQYTLSFWAKSASLITLHFELWGGNGAINLNVATEWTYFTHTFKYIKPGSSTIYFWLTSAGRIFLNNIKLETGNKATHWSAAPEDIQADVDKAQNTADSKNRTFYSDTQPSTPSGGFKVGDLWYKINMIDGCYETYRWNGSGWVIINVNVSKSRIEQTDSRITSVVEKTGIDNLGTGETLWSKINQTADEISLGIGKLKIGSDNLLNDCYLVTVNGVSGQGANLSFSADMVQGETYTLSYESTNITVANDYPQFFIWELGNWTKLQGLGNITAKSRTFKFALATGRYTFTIYNHVYPVAGVINKLKLERGNMATAWSASKEDDLNEIGSSLTLKDNMISLASTTIELKGNTIAKSIEAEDLKVGSRTGASALEVLKDGTFYAKGSSNSNSSLIIDSKNQSIVITSPQSASGEGSSISGSSNVTISSQSGGVRVSGATIISPSSTAIVSNSGIFANTAGQGIYAPSLAIDARASIVGLGWGNIAKDSFNDNNFVAGVYGSATNSGSAPSFGGYFNMLRANGLYLAVRQISSSTTLDKYDCYVSCYNKEAITVYLPSSPNTGQVIYLRQMNSIGFTINGNNIYIHTDGNKYLSVGNRAGQGDTTMLVYDGQFWCLNYMPR